MLVENLTNRMWFSLVCTLINNDTCPKRCLMTAKNSGYFLTLTPQVRPESLIHTSNQGD